MSLAKATVTGTVYRAPEKRFTQNNIAVSSFVLNIGEREEMLIRVISRRTALDDVVSGLNRGDKILVDGRLQTNTVDMENGSKRTVFEIDASAIEMFGAEGASSTSNSSGSSNFGTEEVVKIEADDFSNELINGDEIPF
jgi:single-stranded DNA-binding protein